MILNPHGLQSYFQYSKSIHFGSAQTGSVISAKKVFEKRCDEEVENLTSFNNIYHNSLQHSRIANHSTSNSNRGTPLSTTRRRSPSPVVTGNVSRARQRFESGGSLKNASPYPITTLASKDATESETLQHQTLPRTFRWNSLENPTEVNRFLSRTGTNQLNNCSPTPWRASQSPTPWAHNAPTTPILSTHKSLKGSVLMSFANSQNYKR